MERETVLVTGGNSGIGFECARELARAGRHVVIASRGREASARAVQRIAAEFGADRIEAMELDLAEPESVRRLAQAIEERDLTLRALVCNAGLQHPGPHLIVTSEGYEITFAVNHLGHFLLTNLLLARLVRSAPARIVITASGVHDPKRMTGMPKASVSDIDTLAATGGPRHGAFSGPLAYVNSKLCNLWFSYELGRRLEAAGLSSDEAPLAVNAYDPGLVPGSGLARDYHPAARFVWDNVLPAIASLLNPVVPSISTAEKSGVALARLVLEPGLARRGARYYPSHTSWAETPSSEQSYDPRMARELWEASIRMTKLVPEESPLLG